MFGGKTVPGIFGGGALGELELDLTLADRLPQRGKETNPHPHLRTLTRVGRTINSAPEESGSPEAMPYNRPSVCHPREHKSAGVGLSPTPFCATPWRAARNNVVRLLRWMPLLAHLPVVAVIFSGPLFEGKLPYFRDVAVYYYPNYVFLERSLGQGVWPLWNPTSDAGAPFLITDPTDLLLVGTLGAQGALRVGPPLHLLLAMCGASLLARGLGFTLWGTWASGLFYGLSGYVLSAVNLLELFHATAWAPWVLAAIVRLWQTPNARSVASLGLLAGVQVSTLGAETVLQTGLLGLVLLSGRPDRRRLSALGGAFVLSALLAAPALLGVRTLVEGTKRGQGLPLQQSFAWSARPVTLLDAVVPKLWGDLHTFSDAGFWGQSLFPDGFPYLLSLYVGPALLLLAARSGASPQRWRLWAVVLLGVLLALGNHGPLVTILTPLMRHFRTPPKFLFMADLGLCLLAAQGLARAARGGPPPGLPWLVPGLFMAALNPLLSLRPDLPGALFGSILPEIRDPRAQLVIASSWPASLGTAGALLVGVVLALRSVRLTPLAGLLVALDLLIVNGGINTSTQAAFFDLLPEMKGLVARAESEGRYRWFSYGLMGTRGLHWSPEIRRRNADIWLYRLDRQSLLPRNHVLDGLEGAFDEDRVGWAPAGSTFTAAERNPGAFRQQFARLRLASVRWVLSFRPLPEDLVHLREEVRFPEVLEPLGLYEIRDPLPRAWCVGGHEIVPDQAALARRAESRDFDPRSRVLLLTGDALVARPESVPVVADHATYEQVDPHTARVTVSGPPGYLVVSNGYHPDWLVEANGRPRPLLRANGRYWAVPTDGGVQVFTAHYRPRWRGPALTLCALGLLAALGLLVWPRPQLPLDSYRPAAPRGDAQPTTR